MQVPAQHVFFLALILYQAEVIVVGRVVLDAESSSSGIAKLNEASLWLESSRLMGSGKRLPVKFEEGVKVRGGFEGQGGIGMFPGAIVAFKGKNGGAGCFSVSEIISVGASTRIACCAEYILAATSPAVQDINQ
jgi:hypothetical protein